MNVRSFTELEVWKKARELRKEISTLARLFPKEEKYDLISQIKRSSRSVTIKIAEGCINEDKLKDFEAKLGECLKILNGYINYLQKAKSGSNN